MNTLELLLSSALVALLLIGSVATTTRFVRIASSAQRAFDARVARKYQPLICPATPVTISSTCTQGEIKIVQFHTAYKKFDE
jgi:hypothetical protein